MDLVLIRHAQPIRIEGAGGPADPDLTDLGGRQAKAMAGWLTEEHLDALYVSPMRRARQTAEPLEAAFGMTAGVVDGVQEYDAQADHYIPLEEVKADKDRWRAFVADHQIRDLSEFARTVVSSLEELIGRHRGQRIGVVCHGGVVNVWTAAVLGMEPRMFFEPAYTSINRYIAASSGERSVVSLNETAHLRGLG